MTAQAAIAAPQQDWQYAPGFVRRRSPATGTPCYILTELGVEKCCPNCGDYWPFDGEFWHREGTSHTGYASWCIACKQEYQNGRGGRAS